MNVGILAIQGDFAAHARAVAGAGHRPVFVRRPRDLDDADALILPGGESTAMLFGIERDGLDPPLRAFLASGRPVLGTCAGAILLAARVFHPVQRCYGALDIDIERNAYGTQLDSFETTVDEPEPGSPFAGLRCVLIRAPRIIRVGPGVRVHATVRGDPALVAKGSIWAATFHPELTGDERVLTAVLSGAASGRKTPR